MAPSLAHQIGNLAKRLWDACINTSSISLFGRIHSLLETWRSLLYKRINYVPGVTLSGHSHDSVASRLTLKPFFSWTRPSQTGNLMLLLIQQVGAPTIPMPASTLASFDLEDHQVIYFVDSGLESTFALPDVVATYADVFYPYSAQALLINSKA
ncbi:hypothetical protein RJT34_06243 [Clitoria ternatea]|uniref:Uncharacterized protein n=1 Tax=Clitoria ternatea TaxID=43366 RepID=A0AAN9PTK8_CLITE